ncbi:MAG: aa3-type cytochrome c oxidase subunit IV [Alphaproteobacteria bacterium]|nr:aa3-type cytochrome c oxidase subunit IV [Alphaproteobacteria bacterium]
MSNHHDHASGHPDMDYAEHDKTYHMFINLAKYGTIFCVLLLVFMAVTLL